MPPGLKTRWASCKALSAQPIILAAVGGGTADHAAFQRQIDRVAGQIADFSVRCRCNLLSAEDPVQAGIWLEKGVDCILTDNYLTVSIGLGMR